MAQLLERSHRVASPGRRDPAEPPLRRVEQGRDPPAPAKDAAASQRMRLTDVFVSTNAALLEPPGEAERLVVFAPQRTRALRDALGGDIQAIVEGLRLVDWWPAVDGAVQTND